MDGSLVSISHDFFQPIVSRRRAILLVSLVCNSIFLNLWNSHVCIFAALFSFREIGFRFDLITYNMPDK